MPWPAKSRAWTDNDSLSNKDTSWSQGARIRVTAPTLLVLLVPLQAGFEPASTWFSVNLRSHLLLLCEISLAKSSNFNRNPFEVEKFPMQFSLMVNLVTQIGHRWSNRNLLGLLLTSLHYWQWIFFVCKNLHTYQPHLYTFELQKKQNKTKNIVTSSQGCCTVTFSHRYDFFKQLLKNKLG